MVMWQFTRGYPVWAAMATAFFWSGRFVGKFYRSSERVFFCPNKGEALLDIFGLAQKWCNYGTAQNGKKKIDIYYKVMFAL